MQRLLTILTALLLNLLAGCFVRTELAAPIDGGSVSAGEVFAIGQSDWPTTWKSGPETPNGVIVPVEGPMSIWRGVHLGEFHFLHAGEIERQDAALLAAGLGEPDGFQFRAEGPGSYIFVRDPLYAGPEAKPVPKASQAGNAELFKVVLGWPSEPWNTVARVRIERAWMALYDPIGIEPEQTKGTVVVMPGMFGTPEPVVESLVGTLRRGGWSVLRMLSHPSRFTERYEIEVEEGRTEQAAESIASVLGVRAAACAYTVELALDHALSVRGHLKGKPTVLLGMSGGALVLPTVHAFNPDRYDAAVLIAGGVNYLEINLRSSYADWIEALTVDFDSNAVGVQAPTDEQLKELSRLYLQHAPLDGHRLAPLLVGKPTLMIHGSADRAVPADLGQRLWELAGQPERWTLPVGHELVFAALPFQAGRIERWLTETLVEDDRETPEPKVVLGVDPVSDP